MSQTAWMGEECRHAVTGGPARRAVHAERPRRALRWPIGIAAVLLLTGIAAAWQLRSPDPAPSAPTSARIITADPRP